MRVSRKLASLGVTAVAAAGLSLGTAPQANAAAGLTCPNSQDYCMQFYYNSSYKGSYTMFTGFDHYSLDGYKFLSGGAGQGQYVKNNAASAWNLSYYNLVIYYNSNLAGACDSIPKMDGASQLKNTYNENASFGYGRYDGNCYKF